MTMKPNVRTTILAFCTGVLLACAACSPKAGEPIISGTDWFGKRKLVVGDVVEVSIPFDRARGAEWRLVSFNSNMLELLDEPGPARSGRGEQLALVGRFRATMPGESKIVFQRNRALAGESNQKQFKIKVVEK